MEEYEYNLGDPNTFRVRRAPELERDLLALGLLLQAEDAHGNTVYHFPFSGLTPDGERTRLRMVWGATHKEPGAGGFGLKYCLGRWPTGGARVGPFWVPVVEELGPMRWVVEEWKDPAFLADGGRNPDEHDHLRQGHYDHYWTVATAPRKGFAEGKFRHFDRAVCEVVREMWWNQLNTDEREVEAMRRESLERAEEEKRKKEEEAWEQAREGILIHGYGRG